MATYHTAEVAQRFGLHPNTIRKYEEWALIPKPKRQANGYRVYTDFHIALIAMARKAFQIELLHSNLRRTMIAMIQAAARKDFPSAHQHLQHYQATLQEELQKAEKAANISAHLLRPQNAIVDGKTYSRKAVAEKFSITVDALRNWELNGLLEPQRKSNGHRYYTSPDLDRIQVIKVLRDARYSLEAILQMLQALAIDPDISILATLDSPNEEADIVSVCDQLITSLKQGTDNAAEIEGMLTDLAKIQKS